jgi:site-specific DNA-methyltransferase (adenine-specific)/modification methylase
MTKVHICTAYDPWSREKSDRAQLRVETISDGVTLYHGDCLDVIAELPSPGPGVALVSDPPYGIDYNHGGGNRFGSNVGATKAARKRGTPEIEGDDRPFDPAPWLAYSNCLLWGADHFYPRLPDGGRWLAWNKLGAMEPWDSFSDVEFAWHSGEGAARIFSMMWKGLACDKRGEANGLREHPTQKPVRLMRWCIEEADRTADRIATVVDPYMGAGTTGVAAVMLGRDFVGVEKIERWFDVACRRIGEIVRKRREQPDLFFIEPASSPSPPLQADLDLTRTS